jgi:hypothetical protein
VITRNGVQPAARPRRPLGLLGVLGADGLDDCSVLLVVALVSR